MKFLESSNLEESTYTVFHGPTTLPDFDTPNALSYYDLEQRAKFEIGLFYAYDNTWFLSFETKIGLEKGSLSTTKQTFVNNYGVVAQLNVDPHSAISLTFQNNSKVEQDYHSFKNGHYVDEGLHLSYTKISFLYHRSLFVNPKGSHWWVAAGGVYFAALKDSHSHRDGAEEVLPYSSGDLGLKLSLGQERKIGRFIAGYGVRTERGI